MFFSSVRSVISVAIDSTRRSKDGFAPSPLAGEGWGEGENPISA